MPRTTTPTDEIETLVSEFTQQLSSLVRRNALEQVLASLGDIGGASMPARRAGRPRRATSGASRRGGRRSSVDVEKMGERLLIFVKKNPGQRGEQISKALGTDTVRIRLPMQKLIEAKKVKTKGQRRGTTYFPA